MSESATVATNTPASVPLPRLLTPPLRGGWWTIGSRGLVGWSRVGAANGYAFICGPPSDRLHLRSSIDASRLMGCHWLARSYIYVIVSLDICIIRISAIGAFVVRAPCRNYARSPTWAAPPFEQAMAPRPLPCLQRWRVSCCASRTMAPPRMCTRVYASDSTARVQLPRKSPNTSSPCS